MSRSQPRPWTKFQRTTVIKRDLPPSFAKRMDPEMGKLVWRNNLYTVLGFVEKSGIVTEEFPDGLPILHLSIRRNDRKPVRLWRDLQRIKSEIAGSDVDAMELFPSEDRHLDGANQYHLYCLPKGISFPFGEFGDRSVADEETMREHLVELGGDADELDQLGGKQEPFEHGMDVGLGHPGVVPGFSDLAGKSQ